METVSQSNNISTANFVKYETEYLIVTANTYIANLNDKTMKSGHTCNK